MTISNSTKTTLLAILLGALLVPGVLFAEENQRPTVETARLRPAFDGGEPAAVFGPPPSHVQRWREGLAEILARRDAALEILKADLASATGPDRMELEKLLQARKLDFEIEVLQLQLTIDQLKQPADPTTERAAARQRVAVEIQAARELRDALGVDEFQSARADEASGEEK